MVTLPIDKRIIVKAIDDAKKSSEKRDFKQSVDLVLTLRDINLKKPENRINELVELPNPPKKTVRIGVFATGDLAVRAKKAGADRIIGKEELQTLASDKKTIKKLVKDTDCFIAEAPLMPLIGKTLGSVLGPRGKMPTPVPPTAPIDAIIKKHRKTVWVRIRDQLSTQCGVGTEDMPSEEIAENVQAVIARLEEKLARGLKNIRRVYVKTTMGPPVKIEL